MKKKENDDGFSWGCVLVVFIVESIGKLGWYLFSNGLGHYRVYYIDSGTWWGDVFLTIDLWVSYFLLIFILIWLIACLISNGK